MLRKTQEGLSLEGKVLRMSTGIRNCRGEASLAQSCWICCCPKPELPESGYFQGIFPWKISRKSSQPLWLEINT